MKPESVNPNVRSYLKLSQFTTDADIDRCIRIGLLAVHASQFNDYVANRVGSGGLFILQEFYRNFLGEYQHIATVKKEFECTIRLCNQVSPNGQDGVELQFEFSSPDAWNVKPTWTIRLLKLSASFDTTTKIVLKEYT